ncbi:hypothetical protein [Gracilimonas sp.]|uniref:hypothetical protein n=1 Tax=Gracilimonas sp. TaxID=1974203 RepID=UPI002871CE14|nr:hypothetical protein [Gracilimonas sp.]
MLLNLVLDEEKQQKPNTFNPMDKNEIIQILEDDYGTSNPNDLSETDRAILFETLRSNIRLDSSNPDEYTKQLIIISEALEI